MSLSHETASAENYADTVDGVHIYLYVFWVGSTTDGII